MNTKFYLKLESLRKIGKRRFAGVIISVFFLIPTLYVGVKYSTFDPYTLDLLSNSSKVYDDNGLLVYETYQGSLALYEQVSLEEIPNHCRNAIISTEDRHFYANIGIDGAGFVRGVVAEVTGGGSGSSTISQQLVKLARQSIFNRSPLEKFNEAIYAIKLNASFSKDEILEKYLNNIYLGNYIYGIGAASKEYFGKTVSSLNLAECAFLMGLPQKPSIYNPYVNLELGIIRQHKVLELMFKNDYITLEQLEEAAGINLEFLEKSSIIQEYEETLSSDLIQK